MRARTEAAAPGAPERAARAATRLTRRTGLRAGAAWPCVALAALAAICVGLAVPVAAPGSNVVLATAERSPGWLLGPWRALGASGADGPLAGPLFYAGLWAALIAYLLVLAGWRSIGPRLAIGSIVGLNVLFWLAPPLLSQDVFSYIAYARLDVVHHLNPYTHSPDAAPQDAAFAFAGSRDATSVYGPLFTLATYPLAKLSVPAAFWILKGVAALSTLGVVALASACARRLGRDPVFVALAVGLNPLVLVHVVGGAHNDALVVLLTLAGMLAALTARERAGGAFAASAAAVKASAGLVLPFMAIGSRRRLAVVAGALAATAVVLAAGLAVFGGHTLDALGLISQNQDRTTRWSLPQRSADLIALVSGGSAADIVDFTRAAFALALAGTLVVLVRRTWRARRRGRAEAEREWVASAGWATLALLLASAWLVPWYAIWLLPLAALSGSRRLLVVSLALCAWMLVIAVPL
jgi:alpha-1,6-mannosyltransferase